MRMRQDNMFRFIQEIRDKIEEISKTIQRHDKDNDKRLDDIEKVLLVQETNLRQHMSRSEHLEELVEAMKEKSEQDLGPIKKHINMVEGAFKFMGLLGLIVSVVGGIAKLFGLI